MVFKTEILSSQEFVKFAGIDVSVVLSLNYTIKNAHIVKPTMIKLFQIK